MNTIGPLRTMPLGNDLARFDWSVLDWNAPSIAFYEKIGAKVMNEWKLCRLSGTALARFAREGLPV